MRIKGLELIPVSRMSHLQWLEKRQEGIGGSDVSSIIGINPWFSAIELFYQKIGLNFSSGEHTESTFWGTVVEPVIRDVAQYYNLKTRQYLDNHNNATKLRKIKEFPYMIRNKKHPHLLANIDGLVNPIRNRAEQIFESKTINDKSFSKYETIPTYHIWQISLYMLVCEPMLKKLSAQIYYLINGNRFEGYSIRLSPKMKEIILDLTMDFWERVEKGKEIVSMCNDPLEREQMLIEIEPDPDNTKAYGDFMTEEHKKKDEYVTTPMGNDISTLCEMYQDVLKEGKEIQADKQAIINKVKKYMRDQSADVAESDDFRIVWRNKLYINKKKSA